MQALLELYHSRVQSLPLAQSSLLSMLRQIVELNPPDKLQLGLAFARVWWDRVEGRLGDYREEFKQELCKKAAELVKEDCQQELSLALSSGQ